MNLHEFLLNEFGEGIYDIDTPQFTRTEDLEYDWKPETEDEFYGLVNNAPFEILFGLGFRKWDTIDGYDIILFPGEWYNIIPNGFIYIDIFNKEMDFENGTTDDDIRFGCLAYGIKRKIKTDAAM